MNTFFTNGFKKYYHKRISPYKKLDEQFRLRRKLFISDPGNPILKDHSLSGKMKGHRSFSITGDIRVIYYVHEGIAYFVNIGTHNQVY